jgi:hypothetical protein
VRAVRAAIAMCEVMRLSRCLACRWSAAASRFMADGAGEGTTAGRGRVVPEPGTKAA